jgi:hypothetical protein
MTTWKKWLVRSVAIAALSTTCSAKTPTLTGKIVAYDPILHGGKSATYGSNREELILETPEKKNRYIKVVFVGFGTTQVDEKYFNGAESLKVKALRDKTCDDTYPKIVTQVGLDQKTGTFVLTDAYKSSPPARIKTLECYEATEKK